MDTDAHPDRLVNAILRAWQNLPIPGERYMEISTETMLELAEHAASALRCGAKHPDRPSLVCTDFPHERGALYHRNNEAGVEWCDTSSGLITVHDVLGRIQLTPGPGNDTARQRQFDERTGPEACPECGWQRQDGQSHQELAGGWTRCAHCGWEWRGDEYRRSAWCRVKHPNFDAYCDSHCHSLNTRQHSSSIYGAHWGGETEAQRDRADGYHKVLEALAPVLRDAGTTLFKIDEDYRAGRRTLNAPTARAAAAKAKLCRGALDTIQGLLNNTPASAVTL